MGIFYMRHGGLKIEFNTFTINLEQFSVWNHFRNAVTYSGLIKLEQTDDREILCKKFCNTLRDVKIV
jgi:hypothetical protein